MNPRCEVHAVDNVDDQDVEEACGNFRPAVAKMFIELLSERDFVESLQSLKQGLEQQRVYLDDSIEQIDAAIQDIYTKYGLVVGATITYSHPRRGTWTIESIDNGVAHYYARGQKSDERTESLSKMINLRGLYPFVSDKAPKEKEEEA